MAPVKPVDGPTKRLRFFRREKHFATSWQGLSVGGRDWEDFYRDRWQHDKEVRTTHGVNCTGSCSWKVYVKGGIITWETQQVDYPSNGPDMPEYEPRGCPRGASFSWYIYSPLRVKFPYVRQTLLKAWRRVRAECDDPVDAWARLMDDPKAVQAYKAARGRGGLVRAEWDEVTELIAAATVYTTQKYGPDRIMGSSPIPAMSMVSYSVGTRFLSLLGGTILSFYDWYADLPIASPQIWGDQTDVPESADWYNSGYMIVWGSNIPMTRTPDAHFYAEVRYRGTKVAAVAPDYAEYVKFADSWLPVRAGTDGALGMAMTHVVLKEFYVDRQVPYFQEYARRYTDLPFLVLLRQTDDGYVMDRFLRSSDLGIQTPNAEWKLVVRDEQSGELVVPQGSLGSRWDERGRWNLEPKDETSGAGFQAALTLLGVHSDVVELSVPYFEESGGRVLRRGVPALRVQTEDGERLVTTVLDGMFAAVGVGRGLPGDYPADYDDPRYCTPAWQERLTGVDRKQATRVAREFAENAEQTRGRSMIVMGSGINQWYHSDTTYRAILNLVLLTGCQGVNGGGWAHYVGQEKVRPVEGWATLAFARDWITASRQLNATSFYYFATDQWRYEASDARPLLSPTAQNGPRHFADYNVLAARLGWLPSYPQFDRNPLELAAEARARGASDDDAVLRDVAQQLQDGKLNFAIEDPDAPENIPRLLFIWRSNPLSANGKGEEYIIKHLLGAKSAVLAEQDIGQRPEEIVWRDEAPEGKLDLMVTLDFRMSGSALYSDVVLPAATWYEKHDLSTTDMHPFIHPFNPAITPPWQAKSDWDIFLTLARGVSKLGARHLGVCEDIVASPLAHDSPQELAQPFGQVLDWKRGEIDAVPGKTMPRLQIVKRDYAQIYDRLVALGPRVKNEGIGFKGLNWNAAEQYEELGRRFGEHPEESPVAHCPRLESAQQACETILTLSGTTNGEVAAKGWQALEQKTGQALSDLSAGRRDEHFTMLELTTQPRRVIGSAVWSGIEAPGRQYSPFTVNVERNIPWRTLSGRQHVYLDHQWMLDFGEGLPVYRPPLTLDAFENEVERLRAGAEGGLTLRYLTPHFKWGYHSTYGDNPMMLTLFRGGPSVWLNKDDAAELGVDDNDWVEMVNRHGLVLCRAVPSHRVPRGIVLYYHVQDRDIQVPVSKKTGQRAGGHNSLTRATMKPTHMIGAYAQLSYGFNYYGPIGAQRDEWVVVRKVKERVWHEG